MNLRTEQINGLTCHILDELPTGAKPRMVVVLCHGFGAPGTDLVPIGQMLLQKMKTPDTVQFLFPEAPISLEPFGMPDGRAWWNLDMRRLQIAVATGSFRDLRKDSPPGLPAAREALHGLVKLWSEKTGLQLTRFVLGGFSQGSMLATDLSLHLEENPAGLVILSGTLLNEDTWTPLAPKHKLMRVLQSHGTDDPILPFVAAEWLRDLLNHSGADVDFIPFAGGHEIPFEVMSRLSAFLRDANGDGRSAM